MPIKAPSVKKESSDLFTAMAASGNPDNGKGLAEIQLPKTERKDKYTYSENSLAVLKRRYLAKDEAGESIETPEQMFRRVAKHVASAEKIFNTKYKKPYSFAV